MGWMTHRKWKEIKQQPSMLPGPAVPGSCLVSFHFRWAIHPIRPVQHFCYSCLQWQVTKRNILPAVKLPDTETDRQTVHPYMHSICGGRVMPFVDTTKNDFRLPGKRGERAAGKLSVVLSTLYSTTVLCGLYSVLE